MTKLEKMYRGIILIAGCFSLILLISLAGCTQKPESGKVALGDTGLIKGEIPFITTPVGQEKSGKV